MRTIISNEPETDTFEPSEEISKCSDISHIPSRLKATDPNRQTRLRVSTRVPLTGTQYHEDLDMAEAVSICIPTMFDSRYIIELCLKSILKYTTYPDYKIIVCDAGVDEETNDYLSQLDFIKLIKATDWERPKDDLARAVDTEYYILMHDDIRIFKYGWVQRRMDLMKKDERNAIVGTAPKDKRFFPLGLLVKTDVARKLGLVWGKQVDQGYDTGGLAYEKFAAQDKYKFVKYKFGTDIYHFAEMTWPKYKTEETYDKNKLGKLLTKRERNILKIREILADNAY